MGKRHPKCPTVAEHKIEYCEEFDSYGCFECDQWVDSLCSDVMCGYCAKRPSRPTEAIQDGPVPNIP